MVYQFQPTVCCLYIFAHGIMRKERYYRIMTAKRVGIFIAERRKLRGITQGELAAIMGVSDKAVSKWERNKSYPDVTIMPKLAKELGVTVDELLGGVHDGLLDEAQDSSVRKGSFTRKSKRNKIIFASIGIAIVLVIGGIAGYALANAPQSTQGSEPSTSSPTINGKDKSISSFQECADAGHPVQLTYPETCSVPGGKTFTNN